MLRTTNKRIIDAAMNLIIQKGYRAATTKEIAEKAKVSEATIFRNFKNKQGLMKAMIEQQAPVPESMITKAEGDLYEDLLHFATTLLQQLEQKKKCSASACANRNYSKTSCRILSYIRNP